MTDTPLEVFAHDATIERLLLDMPFVKRIYSSEKSIAFHPKIDPQDPFDDDVDDTRLILRRIKYFVAPTVPTEFSHIPLCVFQEQIQERITYKPAVVERPTSRQLEQEKKKQIFRQLIAQLCKPLQKKAAIAINSGVLGYEEILSPKSSTQPSREAWIDIFVYPTAQFLQYHLKLISRPHPRANEFYSRDFNASQMMPKVTQDLAQITLYDGQTFTRIK